MSFLTEQNLTFHRFSDGTLSNDGKKNPLCEISPTDSIWTTNAAMDYSCVTNPTLVANESATSTTKILPSAVDDSTDNNDNISKRYSTYSVCNNSTTSSGVNNTQYNGSTMKLIHVQKDDSDSSSKQVSSSSKNLFIFFRLLLLLSLNLCSKRYARVVKCIFVLNIKVCAYA